MSKQTVIFSFETGNMIDAGTKMWAFNNDQQSPLRFVPGDFRCSHQEASKKKHGDMAQRHQGELNHDP